ncbi:unnamed protein product [Brassica rapa subsp. trilocularis]
MRPFWRKKWKKNTIEEWQPKPKKLDWLFYCDTYVYTSV